MSPLPAHSNSTSYLLLIVKYLDMLPWHAIPYEDFPLFLLARVSDFR